MVQEKKSSMVGIDKQIEQTTKEYLEIFKKVDDSLNLNLRLFQALAKDLNVMNNKLDILCEKIDLLEQEIVRIRQIK